MGPNQPPPPSPSVLEHRSVETPPHSPTPGEGVPWHPCYTYRNPCTLPHGAHIGTSCALGCLPPLTGSGKCHTYPYTYPYLYPFPCPKRACGLIACQGYKRNKVGAQ